MVVLAQALVSQPTIILVDELSLGLAPVVVKRLVPTLEAVARGRRRPPDRAVRPCRARRSRRPPTSSRAAASATAARAELKDEPDLLHSAYLLRDKEAAPALDSVTMDATPPPG